MQSGKSLAIGSPIARRELLLHFLSFYFLPAILLLANLCIYAAIFSAKYGHGFSSSHKLLFLTFGRASNSRLPTNSIESTTRC